MVNPDNMHEGLAADNVSGVMYQRVKLAIGAADAAPTDVSSAAPLPVSITAGTAGGSSIKMVISAATNNATSVKASAGLVNGWYISNLNAAIMYVKLYDKASAPSPASDTPVITIGIPGNTAGAGTNVSWPTGITFSTGIALAIVTGVAVNNNTAVAANEVVVNLFYS